MFDPTMNICYMGISSTPWSICAVNCIEENKQSTGRQQTLMDSDTLRRIFRNDLIRCDVLVMHATKPIKKNEEVTITRISPLMDYSGKEKYFAFCEYTCDCRLCELDRAEPEHFRQKRNGIFSRACSLMDEILAKQKRERIFDKQLAREVSILLDQVQEMCLNSQRKELQISLATTYSERTGLELLKGSPLKDIGKLGFKELRAMGFDPKVLISDANGPGKFIIPENAIYTFTVRKAIAGLVITYYASGDLKEVSPQAITIL